tara:strand:- start:134 stop:538 length:405 start_codon:yes stop_codon:yes gene_type:complete
MPYDKETGKHYPYTEKGKEQYEKETGKGVPMKNTAYWKDKSGVASPVQHTTNRSVKMMKETVDGPRLRVGSHEEKYGKGHDNSAHPNYWKKERGVGKTDKQKEQKTTARYGVDNRFSLEEQKKREKERKENSKK